MQDFSQHQDYFNALESFPEVADYARGTRLELGDYDAGRNDDKFKLRAFGDARLPIETSNKPHQQCSDFLKSKLYRNGRQLVTCSDCHDLHGGTPYQRWLIHDPDDSASPLCQRCHTVDILSHMDSKLNARMKGLQTRCIDCHMPGTANTGGVAGGFGRIIRTPP